MSSFPATHSGELFGVAYLYAQAGKALHFSEDGLEVSTEEEEEEEDVTTEEACRLDEEVVPDIPPAADSDTSDSGDSDVSEFFTNDLQFCIFFKIYDSQFMRNRHLSLLITASPFFAGRLTVSPPDEEDSSPAVDHRGIEGWDRVDKLAECLLSTSGLSVSSNQVCTCRLSFLLQFS